ncbi:NifU family protein [Sulfurimonas sp.]|nr:NifU family protein [Sulfurimonas sp.]
MTEQEEFKNGNLVKKINMIDKVIEEKIRGYLHQDNGDAELLNVVEQNGHILVYIEFQGACTSCESSGGTHSSMENILQRMLSEDIRVLTV